MSANEPVELSAFCLEIRSLALKADTTKADLYIAICDAVNRLEEMLIASSQYADSLVDLLRLAVGKSDPNTYDSIFLAIEQHEERRRKSVG